MKNTSYLKVGDVVKSERFVNGYNYGGEQKRLIVGASKSTHTVEREMTEAELTDFILKHKHMPASKKVIINIGSSDQARATSEFVVIEVLFRDGRVAHHFYDPTEGWHVIAKKLDPGRVWNDDGEEIEFDMTDGFADHIPPEDIEIVGKMKMRFV